MKSIAALALVVGTSLAIANSQAVAEVGDGERLLAEGIRLRRDGRDQDALAAFQQALREQRTPRALAQTGLCEQALGLWVAAEGHLFEALKPPQDPWIRKNETALQESLAFVKSKIGSVDLWGTPEGARISIDGEAVARLPIRALHVAEGRRVLTVDAPGFISHSRNIDVRAGALSREHVALVAPTAPTAASSAPAAAESVEPPSPTQPDVVVQSRASGLPGWRRVLPWVLLGGAGIAGAIGVWQHLDSNTAADRFDANLACNANAPMRGSDARCGQLYNNFLSSQARAIVAYGAAGLLGAGAVVLFILNANTADDASADDGSDQSVSAVGPGPGDVGLSYSLVF